MASAMEDQQEPVFFDREMTQDHLELTENNATVTKRNQLVFSYATVNRPMNDGQHIFAVRVLHLPQPIDGKLVFGAKPDSAHGISVATHQGAPCPTQGGTTLQRSIPDLRKLQNGDVIHVRVDIDRGLIQARQPHMTEFANVYEGVAFEERPVYFHVGLYHSGAAMCLMWADHTEDVLVKSAMKR